MTVRLPVDKLSRLNNLVYALSTKESGSKRQLQYLARSFNFACQVVHGVRTFLRRQTDCSVNKLKRLSHRCRLTSDTHSEISWWKDFLVTFNGRRMMLHFRQSYWIQTDASFHGFVAVSPDDCFAGSWAAFPTDAANSRLFPSHWCFAGHVIDPSLLSNISFPIFISDRRLGAVWTNKRIFVETENTQALSFINKGTCKNPIAMSWLREIFWLSIRHNFHLRERHLPGTYNRQADRLSRLIQSASFSNYGSFPILRISHAAGPSNEVCVSRGVCKFYSKNASHNSVLTYGYSLLTNWSPFHPNLPQ